MTFEEIDVDARIADLMEFLWGKMFEITFWVITNDNYVVIEFENITYIKKINDMLFRYVKYGNSLFYKSKNDWSIKCVNYYDGEYSKEENGKIVKFSHNNKVFPVLRLQWKL